MNFKKLKKLKVNFVGKFIAATILGMSAAFFAPDVCKNTSFRVLAEGTITTEIALQLMETHYDKNTKTLNLSDTDFTEIGEYAFACRKNKNFEKTKIFEQIEEVILPPNCEKIGRGAFSGREMDSSTRIICNSGSHLKEVTIPSNTIIIDDEAFNNCYRLKDISFVNTQDTPSRLTYIGNRAFSNTSIENISIPNGCEQIGNECLKGCGSLESFYLNPKILSVPAGLCDGCWKLEKFSMGEQVTSIGDKAFRNCSNLKNFDIVTQTEIKSYNVKNFELPENIKFIGKYVFERSPIEHFKIPEKVGSIKKGTFGVSKAKDIKLHKNLVSIGDGACFACFDLSHLTVPEKVGYIGKNCFSSSLNLNQLEFLGDVIVLGKNCFNMCNSLQIVYFPNTDKLTLEGSLSSYGSTNPVILIKANAQINE